MKVVGYLRVSTDQQSESGLGLDAQRNAICEYAKKVNATDCLFFCDEGMSGALALEKRPGMVNAIGSLVQGDELVVAKRDRLGRDPIVIAMIEGSVKRKNARIISIAGEGTNHEDPLDPASQLMRRLIDAFSEYERLIIGSRTRHALKVKKKKGERVGWIPFGFKLSVDGIKLERNDTEVKTVQSIFRLYKRKNSIRSIAMKMNNKGALNRGSKWNHGSIFRIIKRGKIV